MQAGLMNEVISLWKMSGNVDQYGATKRTWVRKIPAVRVHVTFGAQQLRKVNNETVLSEQTTFQMRYSTAITPDMRIQWRGRWFQITAFKPRPNLGELVLVGDAISK